MPTGTRRFQSNSERQMPPAAFVSSLCGICGLLGRSIFVSYVNRKLEMTWPPIYSERPRSGDCNVWRLLTIGEKPEERELTLARDVSPAPRGARGLGAGSRSRPGRGRRC